MTTPSDIRRWLRDAETKGSTHVIVVCDTYDHEDYPVFVTATTQEALDRKIAESSGSMQRIMEVYAMHLPIEAQLQEHRANHRVVAPIR